MGVVGTVKLFTVEYRCHARWHQLDQPPWDQRWVRVGQVVATGRWFVEVIGGVNRPARLYGTDTEAYAVAREVMDHHRGNWEPVPCYPTEAALPEARRRAQERAQETGSQAYSGSDGSKSSTREHS